MVEPRPRAAPGRRPRRGPDGLAVLPGVAALDGTDADHALTVLYAEHYPALVALAALLLDDAAAGEEVAQDAYVKVHAAWGRLRDADAGLAYLRRTVVNLSRSRLRRRRVAEAVAPDPHADGASAEADALAALERRAVVAALGRLPARQRETLVLRYWAGLSEAEIAAALGVSRGAVKSHASRGVGALRVALDAPVPVGDGARSEDGPPRSSPGPPSRPRPRSTP